MKFKILKSLVVITFVMLNMVACDVKSTTDSSKNINANTSEKEIEKNVNTDTSVKKTEKEVEVKKMDMEELHKLISDEKNLDNVLIVDVRTPEEYKEGHIKYAVNYPLDEITNDTSNKDKQIIVYCRSGRRSAQSAKILVDNGFTNVYDAGGVNSYKYELVK